MRWWAPPVARGRIIKWGECRSIKNYARSQHNLRFRLRTDRKKLAAAGHRWYISCVCVCRPGGLSALIKGARTKLQPQQLFLPAEALFPEPPAGNKDHRDINKRRFLALLSSFMVDHKPHWVEPRLPSLLLCFVMLARARVSFNIPYAALNRN